MKKIFAILIIATIGINTFAQNKITKQEREYLNFLYEYMPMSDKADYDTAFYLLQVRSAIEARNTFAWGKKIPEDIFKHFVLVYRVNNENLDTARVVMFHAMKDRIKNMNMYDAALEVNHWCHEYVNYKGSDGRTSAPLATMRTSWGRCGEESTFAVTALRSVGIPARQCYTPRWAHTDDNHAWVEVWIDGTWYHLGACEPEAKLNVAWFDAPSKRAMMVHTTVFGKYNGKEETNFVSDKYSKINLLSNYAPTKKLNVKVVDKNNKPIKGAEVIFGLYNYAEYYPLANIKTDAQGMASLTTGYGDLVIWAKTDKLYNQKQAFANDTDITIILSADNKLVSQSLLLTPPKELPIETLDETLVKKNNERLVYEDSIRNAYIATFPKSDNDLITNSWGNYKNIQAVINTNHPLANKMLHLVYEKDLRDVDYATFMDHLNNIKPNDTSEYIINPRIQLEQITPWRSFIKKYFSSDFKTGDEVAKWIQKNIKINTQDNYYGVPISPKGVITTRESDEKSKQILFVAICRTFGIQARYEWATGRAQWRKDENSNWQYGFKQKDIKEANDCTLIVNNSASNQTKPEYFYQFTIQKLVNNEYKTLDYEYDPHFASFPDTLKVSEGKYRMIVGNRNSTGRVSVNETYFDLTSNKTTNISVVIPEAKEDITFYGKIDLNNSLQNISYKNTKDGTTNIKQISNNSKATILAIIDPYKEPSRHLLVDIAKSKADFDKENQVYLILVLDESLLNKDFSTEVFPELPENTIVLLDKNKTIENKVLSATGLKFLNNYPILTLVNKQDIIYLSQGYKISSQEELLKTIKKLK